MVTQERLRELFVYRSGELYWKNMYRKKKRSAGSLRPDGYLSVRVDSKTYLLHRLIYIYHFGRIGNIIDHINRNKLDNRIENLREVTPTESSANIGNFNNRKNLTSRYKGVSLIPIYKTRKISKKSRPWRARITSRGKTHALGIFKCECDAAMVFNEESLKLNGDMAVLNVSDLNYLSTNEILAKFSVT